MTVTPTAAPLHAAASMGICWPAVVVKSVAQAEDLARLAPAALAAAALGETAAMQREQLQHLVGRLCGAEQIALHLRAPERAQQALLLLGLDAFGGGGHAARGRQIDDGLHDAGGAVGAGDVADEATVDLDLVEREAVQIAQRGIAGAEIVERDA